MPSALIALPRTLPVSLLRNLTVFSLHCAPLTLCATTFIE